MKTFTRKLMSVVIAASFCFGLASCSKTPAASSASSETTTAVETKASESETTAAESKAEVKTVTAGKLIMATNATFPPYEYHDGDKIVGIDAEIAKAIADKLGLELVIEDVAFDSIIAGVQAGKYDIGCAGMTVTEDRLKSVNFSTSYATGIQSIIVKEGSDIKTIDDLIKGKYKVGVQSGTTGDIYMSDAENGGVGEERIDRYNNGNDAVVALLAGKIDAICIDNEPAKAYVAANKGLSILETPFTEEKYAIAISKDNEALLTAINKALDELTKDGTIAKIVEKYIPTK
ncbi:MAG: basic amino acid ABC transporter substrate-binding protein [Clostridiales bacterium]|nr:basic amino acid ABC transporter substrate-binding protein [Clostridiales bacterium]MBR6487618.1 basic amino acid ABC transporter substrate-binding protein [Clostridiales bacterium]